MKKPKEKPDLRRARIVLNDSFVNPMRSANLTRFVRECERDYLPWQKVRAECPKGLDATLAWTWIQLSRRICRRWAGLQRAGDPAVHYQIPPRLERDLHVVDQCQQEFSRTGKKWKLSSAQHQKLNDHAGIEEAIATCQLDGIDVSTRDARKALQIRRMHRNDQEWALQQTLRSVRMVCRYFREDFTRENIAKLHQSLSEQPMKESENLKILCDFACTNAKSDLIHPLLRAGLIYYWTFSNKLFGPYCGRMARLLFLWSILKSEYSMFQSISISQPLLEMGENLHHALRRGEEDEQDATYFLIHLGNAAQRSCREFISFIRQRAAATQEAERAFDGDARLNRRQRELLLRFQREPGRIVNIADHRLHAGVAYATARADLMDLAEYGYLRQTRAGKRYQYRAGEKLSSGG